MGHMHMSCAQQAVDMDLKVISRHRMREAQVAHWWGDDRSNADVIPAIEVAIASTAKVTFPNDVADAVAVYRPGFLPTVKFARASPFASVVSPIAAILPPGPLAHVMRIPGIPFPFLSAALATS